MQLTAFSIDNLRPLRRLVSALRWSWMATDITMTADPLFNVYAERKENHSVSVCMDVHEMWYDIHTPQLPWEVA